MSKVDCQKATWGFFLISSPRAAIHFQYETVIYYYYNIIYTPNLGALWYTSTSKLKHLQTSQLLFNFRHTGLIIVQWSKMAKMAPDLSWTLFKPQYAQGVSLENNPFWACVVVTARKLNKFTLRGWKPLPIL